MADTKLRRFKYFVCCYAVDREGQAGWQDVEYNSGHPINTMARVREMREVVSAQIGSEYGASMVRVVSFSLLSQSA